MAGFLHLAVKIVVAVKNNAEARMMYSKRSSFRFGMHMSCRQFFGRNDIKSISPYGFFLLKIMVIVVQFIEKSINSGS